VSATIGDKPPAPVVVPLYGFQLATIIGGIVGVITSFALINKLSKSLRPKRRRKGLFK
jgi:hypothetical protein